MFCPKCGAEYRDGFTRCSDCDVDLVESPPQSAPRRGRSPTPAPSAPELPEPRDDPPERFALVTVLATTDPGLVGVAESLLRSADIPFVSEADNIIDLFGLGRLSGVNPITGPARLRVAPQDADDARAVLADLVTAGDAPVGDDVAHSSQADQSDSPGPRGKT